VRSFLAVIRACNFLTGESVNEFDLKEGLVHVQDLPNVSVSEVYRPELQLTRFSRAGAKACQNLERQDQCH
jgi:hypothetical protein